MATATCLQKHTLVYHWDLQYGQLHRLNVSPVAPFVNDVQLQYIKHIYCESKFMKLYYIYHIHNYRKSPPVVFSGVMVVILDLYSSLMWLMQQVVVFISAARPQSQTCLPLTSYIVNLINMIFANIEAHIL